MFFLATFFDFKQCSNSWFPSNKVSNWSKDIINIGIIQPSLLKLMFKFRKIRCGYSFCRRTLGDLLTLASLNFFEKILQRIDFSVGLKRCKKLKLSFWELCPDSLTSSRLCLQNKLKSLSRTSFFSKFLLLGSEPKTQA